jgi:hypothetical protein
MEAERMEESLISSGVLTMMIVEVLKRLRVNIKSEWLPFASIGVAALLNTLIGFANAGASAGEFDFAGHLLAGIAAGLAASGGYDSLSSLLSKKKGNGNGKDKSWPCGLLREGAV